MKIILIVSILFLFAVPVKAQEYTSFEIESISKEAAWSAVQKTFKEQKLPVPALFKNSIKGESGFYKYTSLMIQQRFRFLVQYESDKLIISITERQYLTDKGWADNLIPMSKKQASKILDPIRDRIIELTNDEVNVGNASIAPIAQKTETVNTDVKNHSGNQSQTLNLQDGLILKYPFNGSATDISGKRHNGTVSGAKLVNDRFGNEFSAYSFNGISDFISVPEDVYFEGDFTISAWINPRQIKSWNRILDFGNGGNAQNVFLAITQSSSGKPAGSVFGPQGRNFTEITSNSKTPLNRWSHIVFLLQGSTAKLFLNRELVAVIQNFIIPPSVKRSKNYIGRSNWPQDGFTDATIDDIAMYSRALNEAEIEALFYEGDNSQILISEDFESSVLHEWIKKSSTGTFTNSPGAKNIRTLLTKNLLAFPSCGNGEKVYDFGLSTCAASCYNQYTSTLGLMLPDTEYITSISFKDFELGQNWGSKGEIMLDGKIMEDFEFGKKPANDRKSDTDCRQHSIFIGKKISKIEFAVSDITKSSELVMDDLVIRYKIRKPEEKPPPDIIWPDTIPKPDEPKPETITENPEKEIVMVQPEILKKDSLLTILVDDIFENTRCPKRTTRFMLFNDMEWDEPGLQKRLDSFHGKIDSIGAKGWSICKDLSLFPMYLMLSHDTLSSKPRNEKYSYKIFIHSPDKFGENFDSLNICGSQGYELMSMNGLMTIMMKDETNNQTANLHFEYKLQNDIADAFSTQGRYQKNGQEISEMLNQMGAEGWELFLTTKNSFLMQRVRERKDVKYEYKLVNMKGVSDVKKLFNTIGAQGWDYCLWPMVMHLASDPPPIIIKRNTSLKQEFEYNFKFIPTIDLFDNKSFDRSFNEMMKVFQEPQVKGWKFKNGLVIDESFDDYDDKIFFVFQVDKSCK